MSSFLLQGSILRFRDFRIPIFHVFQVSTPFFTRKFIFTVSDRMASGSVISFIYPVLIREFFPAILFP